MPKTFKRCMIAVLSVCMAAPAVAANSGNKVSFIISSRDGYGISECLGENGACGRVVADSWCEAHGLSKASSFGVSDDLTAAIPGTAAVPANTRGAKTEPGSYVINCEP